MYEVCKPLYCIPSLACAQHFTLDNWLTSLALVKLGFEESIWIREAGGEFPSKFILNAHINDELITCKDLDVLTKFKQATLRRFEGIDEGAVTDHLG